MLSSSNTTSWVRGDGERDRPWRCSWLLEAWFTVRGHVSQYQDDGCEQVDGGPSPGGDPACPMSSVLRCSGPKPRIWECDRC